jgi:hypothetical protein
MATDTYIQELQSPNPFRSHRSYSDSGVELMRAMSAQRKESGRANSTPEELLATVAELGYRQPEYSTLPVDIEARRFSLAMNEYQS